MLCVCVINCVAIAWLRFLLFEIETDFCLRPRNDILIMEIKLINDLAENLH